MDWSTIDSIVNVWFVIGTLLYLFGSAISKDQDQRVCKAVTQVKEVIILSLSTMIYFGFRLADGVLGRKLFFIRSYIVSLAISACAGIMFFLTAIATSPKEFAEAGILEPLSKNFASNVTIAYFTLTILIGLTIDYFSVVQTRLLIKHVRVDSSNIYSLSIILIDFALSNLIFLFGHSFVVALALTSKFVLAIGAASSGSAYLLTLSFYSNIKVFSEMIFLHYYEYFMPFFSQNYSLSVNGAAEETIIVYPLTTMYATTFTSSIWIYVCVTFLTVARLLASASRLISKNIIWIWKHPSAVKIFAISFSLAGSVISLFVFAH